MSNLDYGYDTLTDIKVMMDRHKTLKILVKQKNAAGNFTWMDTTGMTFHFTVKRAYDATPIIYLQSDGTNVLHYNDATGDIRVFLRPGHTNDLMDRKYYYDFVMQDENQQFWPVLRGRFDVLWSVYEV